MSRRRQTPWIHRWSRYLIAAIAAVGALGTGYLTLTRFFGGTTTCPTGGCDTVLTSAYATVFGLPLTLFGFLAYFSMGIMALAPLAVNPEQNKDLRLKLENWSWLYLLVGSTAMSIFSGYLMYILATELKQVCLYCIVSACLSLSLFVITLLGRTWEDLGQLLFIWVIVAVVTLTGTLAVYAGANGTGVSKDNPGPPITTVSSQAEVELAKHLKSVGAVMYGAYWCPHCHDQKQLFGKEAFAQINYIECAEDVPNSGVAQCRAIAPKVKEATGQDFGFPTWEINGKFLVGTQTLEQLAEATGYQGPRNFQTQR